FLDVYGGRGTRLLVRGHLDESLISRVEGTFEEKERGFRASLSKGGYVRILPFATGRNLSGSLVEHVHVHRRNAQKPLIAGHHRPHNSHVRVRLVRHFCTHRNGLSGCSGNCSCGKPPRAKESN